MPFFYLKFFLTNIVFSLITGAVLVRYGIADSTGEKQPGTWELALYSLGLGPMVTVLLLYYLLLLAPGRGTAFYLAGVCLLYAFLAYLGRKGFVTMWQQTHSFLSNFSKDKKTLLYWAVILLLLLVFLWTYFGAVQHNRMEGHDALIYGNFGKMYQQQKKIGYSAVMLPADNGFLFQGSPKPAFSLLLTWELMLNNKSLDKTVHFDAYFRSISGYYSLLILAVVFLWLYRKNRWFALFGTLMLFSSVQFFVMTLDHHLDSFRIFFLAVSWIGLAYRIKKKDGFSFFLFALFSGFAAFAHLIGFIIAAINALAFLVFDEDTLKKRLVNTALFFLLVLAFGSVHYFLEALFGSESGFLNYFLQ
jgi:4-amino-4-deoxy-L-arabinose transferase-like glycosyltransferase